jgi:hypothetical protein
MASLRELQLGLSRDVFAGGETRFGAYIQANGIPGDQRLGIYRNNAYQSFTQSLRGTYPVVERLVGEEFFRYAAREYITQYPATSGNLHDFGGSFCEFLSAFEPAASLTYLPDVARLEWYYERVYYEAHSPPLNPAALTGVPEERYGDLRFVLNPACRLLRSDYPILRIWQVGQAEYEDEPSVDFNSGGDTLLLIRTRTLNVEIQRIETGEFTLLHGLADGLDFAAACEAALDSQADFDVAASFRKHIAQGALIDFSL